MEHTIEYLLLRIKALENELEKLNRINNLEVINFKKL
jgi:hypothetical protein